MGQAQRAHHAQCSIGPLRLAILQNLMTTNCFALC